MCFGHHCHRIKDMGTPRCTGMEEHTPLATYAPWGQNLTGKCPGDGLCPGYCFPAGVHGLARCYANMGRQADARKLREETLALRKAKLGADHPDTLMSMITLAISYAAAGRHQDAFKLLEERQALQARRGPDHPDMLYEIACVHATLARSRDRAAEADVAILWLKKAVAAGFTNTQVVKTDPDLTALRDRADFKKLLADLDAENAKK
jgi:hypothetical protein